MRGIAPKKLGVIVAIVALATFGWSLFAPAPASAAGPSVAISSLETGVGFEGKVDLEAFKIPQPGLGAWTIDVHYNPEVVTLLDCGAEHGGICNEAFAENAARVTGVSAFGLPGGSYLATLVFACKKVGSSDLGLSINVLADATVGNPQPIEAALAHGEIVCGEEPPAPPKPPGDANCDGVVSAVDATLILQYGAEMIESVPCPDAADVNGDGEINAIDATIVLQIVAGLID